MLDCAILSSMSTESVTPDLQADDGVVLGAGEPQPRWGERAALIRKMATRYPELSQAAIARRVGCTEGNVSQVLKSYLKDTDLATIEDFRSDKSLILESFQHRTLSSITDADISKTPFIQRITAFAIMEDKIRLMRGQATSIQAHMIIDVLDALRSKEEQW